MPDHDCKFWIFGWKNSKSIFLDFLMEKCYDSISLMTKDIKKFPPIQDV